MPLPSNVNSWNAYQNRLKCCAVNNYTDLSENGKLTILQSCCSPDFLDFAGNRSRQSIFCELDFLHCNSDVISGRVYGVGCKSSVESGIQDYKYNVLYVGTLCWKPIKQEKKTKKTKKKRKPIHGQLDEIYRFVAVLPLSRCFLAHFFAVAYCNTYEQDKIDTE